MCNFYGYQVSLASYIRLQKIEKQLGTLLALSELKILYNGFEYGKAPVLRKTTSTDFELELMHWEFIPSWIRTMEDVKKARKQGIPWLNASSEKLLESKMFREAALKRRCLVPASHFFEWRSFKPASAKKEIKYPYCIADRKAEYFFMAGIWNPFTDKETGETFNCFAIVTTAANPIMQQIHNNKKRMPLILPEPYAWQWLMEDLNETEIKEIISIKIESIALKAHTISKDFKTSLQPLAKYEYEELPSINL